MNDWFLPIVFLVVIALCGLAMLLLPPERRPAEKDEDNWWSIK
jgi:hypothetical protein